MIIGDFNLEAGEIKEGDNFPSHGSEPGPSQKPSTEKTLSEDSDVSLFRRYLDLYC